jgi:hypothetical protein
MSGDKHSSSDDTIWCPPSQGLRTRACCCIGINKQLYAHLYPAAEAYGQAATLADIKRRCGPVAQVAVQRAQHAHVPDLELPVGPRRRHVTPGAIK